MVIAYDASALTVWMVTPDDPDRHRHAGQPRDRHPRRPRVPVRATAPPRRSRRRSRRSSPTPRPRRPSAPSPTGRWRCSAAAASLRGCARPARWSARSSGSGGEVGDRGAGGLRERGWRDLEDVVRRAGRRPDRREVEEPRVEPGRRSGRGGRAARRRRWRSRSRRGSRRRRPSRAARRQGGAAFAGSTRLPPAVRNSTCRSDAGLAEHDRLDDLVDGAAAGARRVLGGAGALGEPDRLDREPAPRRVGPDPGERARPRPQRSSTST